MLYGRKPAIHWVFLGCCLTLTAAQSNTLKPNTDPAWPSNYTGNGWYPHNVYPEYIQRYTCLNSTGGPSLYTFNLARPSACVTPQSKDFYGFGVRLGFYFTWMGSFIANSLVPGEIASAIDANSMFLFALEVSILKGTVQRQDAFMRIDAVIMLLIGAGTTVGTLSLWGYRTSWYRREGRDALRHFGGFGTHARMLLCFLCALYWLWFWYFPSSRHLTVPNCDPRCRVAFVFGRPVSSNIRWLFFVMGFIYAIYWGVMLPVSSIALFKKLGLIYHGIRKKAYDESSKLMYKTGLSYKQLKKTYIISNILIFLWFIMLIALIEHTLQANNARGSFVTAPDTASPSQLIPLLIGATTLVRICYFAYKSQRYSTLHPSKSASEVRKEKRKAARSKKTAKTSNGDGSDHDDKDKNKNKIPTRHKTYKKYSKPLRLFSPAYFHPLHPSDHIDVDKENDKDDDEKYLSTIPVWRRVLVTWLPWLGLLEGFIESRDDDDAANDSYSDD